jgi:DNA-directed RNA polymerase subunit RPC12/RpoP
MTESGSTGRPILQRCAACGVDFDHDVARCPDCGQRTAIGRRRAIIFAVVVVLAIAILGALWAAAIIPEDTISPRGF